MQFGKIIDLLMQRLTVEEKTQLKEYYNGKIFPVNSDPFPNILITPDLKGLNIYIFFFGLGRSGGSELSRCSK